MTVDNMTVDNMTINYQKIWKMKVSYTLLLVAAVVVLLYAYYDGLERMVYRWGSSEEYGYGYIIPLISAFFIWQKKNELSEQPFTGSWVGLIVLLLGGILLVLGELASLFIVTQYAFLVALAGLALAVTGWRIFLIIAAPLAVLVFMIPLPQFIYANLSSELQLISSQLGVFVIRLFGISVYLEGNVIDLGTYKLQVVEACSGLRYLFPLASLAFIAAYMFRGAFWKKAIIFLSSVPITVFMNSLRIGVIGVLVEYGGPGQAEGFLHYFEGWVIFMGCMAILILEIWVLASVGKDKLSFSEAFAIDLPESRKNSDVIIEKRTLPVSFIVAWPVVLLIAIATSFISERSELIPDRTSFADFPMETSEWKGKPDRLEQIYLDVLKLDDYVIADYVNSAGKVVNFYSAYYASQRKGESAHSPRSCIPGGGWQIKDLSQKSLDGVLAGDIPVSVNRLVIAKGDYKQLVYYWFQGRNRIINNEYMVKWYLFWDALTKSRTDGALVRLTAFLDPSEDIVEADQRLTLFAKDISPHLADYIPN